MPTISPLPDTFCEFTETEPWRANSIPEISTSLWKLDLPLNGEWTGTRQTPNGFSSRKCKFCEVWPTLSCSSFFPQYLEEDPVCSKHPISVSWAMTLSDKSDSFLIYKMGVMMLLSLSWVRTNEITYKQFSTELACNKFWYMVVVVVDFVLRALKISNLTQWAKSIISLWFNLSQQSVTETFKMVEE